MKLPMEISIKKKNVELSSEVKELIAKQIKSLEKFARNIFAEEKERKFLKRQKPLAKVEVELEKITKHQKGPFFRVECQIAFLGRVIRAEKTSENLETALSKVKESLQRELKQYKKKIAAKFKRGARTAKREFLVSEAAKKKEGKRVWREGI